MENMEKAPTKVIFDLSKQTIQGVIGVHSAKIGQKGIENITGCYMGDLSIKIPRDLRQRTYNL